MAAKVIYSRAFDVTSFYEELIKRYESCIFDSWQDARTTFWQFGCFSTKIRPLRWSPVNVAFPCKPYNERLFILTNTHFGFHYVSIALQAGLADVIWSGQRGCPSEELRNAHITQATCPQDPAIFFLVDRGCFGPQTWQVSGRSVHRQCLSFELTWPTSSLPLNGRRTSGSTFGSIHVAFCYHDRRNRFNPVKIEHRPSCSEPFLRRSSGELGQAVAKVLSEAATVGEIATCLRSGAAPMAATRGRL